MRVFLAGATPATGRARPSGHEAVARAEPDAIIHQMTALLLERLSPVERAVFLLHDVFAYHYDEIAPIVDKSPANCRQVALRARGHVESDKPRFEASRRACSADSGGASVRSGSSSSCGRSTAGPARSRATARGWW
jgi:hypothetical protein